MRARLIASSSWLERLCCDRATGVPADRAAYAARSLAALRDRRAGNRGYAGRERALFCIRQSDSACPGLRPPSRKRLLRAKDRQSARSGSRRPTTRGMQDFISSIASAAMRRTAAAAWARAVRRPMHLRLDARRICSSASTRGGRTECRPGARLLPESTIWELVAYVQSIAQPPSATFGRTISRTPQSPIGRADARGVPADRRIPGASRAVQQRPKASRRVTRCAPPGSRSCRLRLCRHGLGLSVRRRPDGLPSR